MGFTPNSICHLLFVVAPNDLKYQFLCAGTQNAICEVQYDCDQRSESPYFCLLMVANSWDFSGERIVRAGALLVDDTELESDETNDTDDVERREEEDWDDETLEENMLVENVSEEVLDDTESDDERDSVTELLDSVSTVSFMILVDFTQTPLQSAPPFIGSQESERSSTHS